MILSSATNFRWMIRPAIAFLLFFATMSVFAQGVEPRPLGTIGGARSDDDDGDLPAQELTEIPVIEVKSMAARPSLVPVFQAVGSSKMSGAHAEILVEYNMQGDITDVKLLNGAGNGSVNKAILEWARRVKLIPGEAGKGRLLFDMEMR